MDEQRSKSVAGTGVHSSVGGDFRLFRNDAKLAFKHAATLEYDQVRNTYKRLRRRKIVYPELYR